MMQIFQSNPYDPKHPKENIKKKKKDEQEVEESSIHKLSIDLSLSHSNDKIKTLLRSIRNDLHLIQDNIGQIYELQQKLQHFIELLRSIMSLALQSSNEIYQNEERENLLPEWQELVSRFIEDYTPLTQEFKLNGIGDSLGKIHLRSLEWFNFARNNSVTVSIATQSESHQTANSTKRFIEHLLDEQVKLNDFENILRQELDAIFIKLNEIHHSFVSNPPSQPNEVLDELKDIIQKMYADHGIQYQIPPDAAIQLLKR